MAIIRSQSAGSRDSRLRFLTFVPALQTSTSIASKAARIWSTTALTANRSLISQAATKAESRPAGESGPGPLEFLAVAAEEGHAQAHLGQGGRDAPPDAASRPRDQCRFQSRGQGCLLLVQASIPRSARSATVGRSRCARRTSPVFYGGGPIGGEERPDDPARIRAIGPSSSFAIDFERNRPRRLSSPRGRSCRPIAATGPDERLPWMRISRAPGPRCGRSGPDAHGLQQTPRGTESATGG